MTYRIAKTAFAAAVLTSAAWACSKNDAQTPRPSEEIEAADAPASAPAASAATATDDSSLARGSDAERKSKNGMLEADIGGVSVHVLYGRPEARGRALFGDLVPYGEVWRTGADEATTITLDKDTLFEGQKVPAGSYALFTIPNETEWTVVLNRTAKQWGAYKYDQAQDLLRVEVTPMQKEHTEALTFETEGDHLVLRWGTLAVPMKIEPAS